MTALETQLAASMATTKEIRRQRKALQRAQTEIRLYRNNPDGSAGLQPVGRLNVFDVAKYNFDQQGNVSKPGMFEVRANHWLAQWIASVPNNPAECKNIVIRVDKFGGLWRWTGLLHHWQVYTRDGVDYLMASFNDDMQTIQFMLAPPNPLLPIDIFQFPRDWPQFAPSCWSIGTLIWLQIVRKQAEEFVFALIEGLFMLVTDPFDFFQWVGEQINLLAPWNWQLHVACPTFWNDSSLWTFIGSRMNTVDSVIAAALDDGQLSLSYRRYFTAEGEQAYDLWGNLLANGAMILNVQDKSQFHLPVGSFFSGTAAEGLIRSVLQWTDGFVEDTLNVIQDNENLYPNEYWQTGFLGTFAAAPALVVRDSWWNDLQSIVTYAPATAVTVIVGGDNPTADAIVKLIIECIGDLLGYFLLGGFDSLGEIISGIVMPFLVGTILAWIEWENVARKSSLGWVHLFESYQQGAENNAWSFAALAALRGGFLATASQTSHTMVIDDSQWAIPGAHFTMKDRIASSCGALQRMGVDVLFVNQVEEMNLSGDDTGKSKFVVKVGKNDASKTTGERMAQQMKFALDKLADIGVRLIN